MSEDGLTHFKNLGVSASDHFGILCIKGLQTSNHSHLHIFIRDCEIHIDFDKINRKYLQVTK